MSQKMHPEMMSTIEAVSQHNQKLSNCRQPTSQCRICLQQSSPLIMPCRCDGTVKYVHEQCLKLWANEVLKRKLKQQAQEDDFQQLNHIKCQLCKSDIQLEVKWSTVWLTFQQAKQTSQEFFWPLLILNVLIFAACVIGFVVTIALIIMVTMESTQVDFQRYSNEPIYMWGMTAGTLLFSILLFVKTLKQLYQTFVKREFEVKDVLKKQPQNSLKYNGKANKISIIPYQLPYDFKKPNQTFPVLIQSTQNTRLKQTVYLKSTQQQTNQHIILNNQHVKTHAIQ